MSHKCFRQCQMLSLLNAHFNCIQPEESSFCLYMQCQRKYEHHSTYRSPFIFVFFCLFSEVWVPHTYKFFFVVHCGIICTERDNDFIAWVIDLDSMNNSWTSMLPRCLHISSNQSEISYKSFEMQYWSQLFSQKISISILSIYLNGSFCLLTKYSLI